MRRQTWLARQVALLLALLLLTRCWGGTPTPLPWVPTATPSSGSGQAAVTPDATPTPPRTVQSDQATAEPLPSMTPTPTVPAEPIVLEVPSEGQIVSNPLELWGRTVEMPFEGTLVIRIYDAQDRLLAEEPIIAEGELGGPATFTAAITYGGVPGAGRVEVLEFSPQDGSVVAQTSVNVTLGGFPGGGFIEKPVPQAAVTLPVQLIARVGRPDQDVNVTVTWEDGTQFAHVFTTLEGLDGQGLLILPMDWVGSHPNHPQTQKGAIEIHTLEGSPLAWQPVQILHPEDPDTMGVNVYWIDDGEVVAQPSRLPRTVAIGRASLEALIWGPVPQNEFGYTTALPTPEEVLNYGARGPEWGERVVLRDLTIEDSVASADFSPEILAYPGGATRALLIRAQIEETLLQFSTVDEVEITVDGQPDRLEP